MRYPESCSLRINVAKNQVVWARCHFAGLASGIDCTNWSSGDRGAARRSVSFRTGGETSVNLPASVAESEKNDGEGSANGAAADAGFVTGDSDLGENVGPADGFQGAARPR